MHFCVWQKKLWPACEKYRVRLKWLVSILGSLHSQAYYHWMSSNNNFTSLTGHIHFRICTMKHKIMSLNFTDNKSIWSVSLRTFAILPFASIHSALQLVGQSSPLSPPSFCRIRSWARPSKTPFWPRPGTHVSGSCSFTVINCRQSCGIFSQLTSLLVDCLHAKILYCEFDKESVTSDIVWNDPQRTTKSQ